LTLIVLLLLFVFLLFLGIPVGFSMLFASIFYIIINGSPAFIFVVQRLSSGLDSFTLLAIPFFILAANLMNELDVSKKIFDFANTLVGHFKGGLVYVNIIASLIFSGMSGSSAADFGGLGNVEINEMKRKNYPKALSAAVTAASSAIGPVFPPSVMLVLFGVMTRTSVGRLFLGGVIPGILMTIVLMAASKLKINNIEIPEGEKFYLIKVVKNLKENIFAIFAPALLLIFLITGIVTPSELGIILVIYTLFVGFLYKRLSFNRIQKGIVDSVYLGGQILFMIATASVFSNILIRENVPQILLSLMSQFYINEVSFLILLEILLLFLGCFLEGTSLEILLVPIVTPVAIGLGIDTTQLGVIMVLAIEIGLITPPMGMGVFIASHIAKVSVEKTFHESWLYFWPLLLVLLLITIFPNLVLWLPNLFLGI